MLPLSWEMTDNLLLAYYTLLNSYYLFLQQINEHFKSEKAQQSDG